MIFKFDSWQEQSQKVEFKFIWKISKKIIWESDLEDEAGNYFGIGCPYQFTEYIGTTHIIVLKIL